MRTLLVDNHDSFTHNLFHYLAEVNGQEPEVIPNDFPSWRPGHLSAFDNVVLSPGPGHPARSEDFGICAAIVGTSTLPVLGVCLGHQGIALAHGARVGLAPRPVHGYTSPVRHLGTGLFAGLPQEFRAVRYHSLAVDRLPDDVEAIAWTPDGVLMGLRHRHRPQWGVQFHPESIGGFDGHALLDNFRRLTERHRPHGRTVHAAPRRPATPGARPAQRRRLRVRVREVPVSWGAEQAFDALFRAGRHAYWLDSSRPDADTGRFSIMGGACGPLGRVARADVWKGTVTVTGQGGATRTEHRPFLSWIEQDLRAIQVETPDLPCEFTLGWVGYLGYELKAECGGERTHQAQDPDALMVFSDRALVLDHLTGRGYLLALEEPASAYDQRPWLADATRRLAALQDAPAPPEPPAPLQAGPGAGALRLRHDRDEYLRLIDECREEATRGESYEICLTNMAESDTTTTPWDGYRRMRRAAPAPYGALLSFGGLSVLSTSFERFLRIDRHGRMDSRPVKGTRPRGADPGQDAALRADLLVNAKDRAENLMIVDLVRNDLGRCARVGSVRADDLFRVESYARVHQLVSTVTARKHPDADVVDCVRAAFPPGSMTGAPKLRTMRIIDRLEQGPRGVYAGAIGYLSLNGTADLSVVIRTAVMRGAQVRYGVGGAILVGSDPEAEFEETAVKAAPLTALTGAPFPGEPVRAPAAR
ncbi:aminodeoxychorismate synthase component I [Streptomyces sp. NPDC050485]|uniref:aminodeoxychorismate synthase component I n=1 Tax=Streptomyces sp. NPDC050485 TaxID=3365617 RepID=UPI0037954CE4